jgi:hypothetical protein
MFRAPSLRLLVVLSMTVLLLSNLFAIQSPTIKRLTAYRGYAMVPLLSAFRRSGSEGVLHAG